MPLPHKTSPMCSGFGPAIRNALACASPVAGECLAHVVMLSMQHHSFFKVQDTIQTLINQIRVFIGSEELPYSIWMHAGT